MRIRIADVRKTLGIKQSELASRVGISRPYLAQIESGERNLTAKRQDEIAKALGVDPSDLVDFSGASVQDEDLILRAFQSGSQKQREMFLAIARTVLDTDSPPD